MAKRYFEFSDGSSNKFWEVWVDGTNLMTRYGKIGASGQTTIKNEGSPDGAQKLHDKLVREKTGKGYQEKGGGSAPAAAAKAAPAKAAQAKVAAPAEPKAPAAAAKAPSTTTVEAGFRRFEFSEGGSNKFWEVKVEEEQQVVRFGRIGTEGQVKEKDFDSASEAKADTKKLIAEKTEKGYAEVGGKPPPLSNPEMEAEIAKNPDDARAYLVYADWLQSKGDPLGELIALQNKAATNNDAKKAAAALLKKHSAHFMGELADFGDRDEHEIKIEWQNGFIKTLKMSWPMFDDGGNGGDQAAEDFNALLSLPVARFIQKLELGPVPGEEEMALGVLTEVLEQKKGSATLRELYLGDTADWDISSTSSEIGDIAKLFPKLEKLTVRGGNITLKKLDHPLLKSLTVETGGLGKQELKAITSMKTPNLESLKIWFGDEEYGGACDFKDIAPILDGSAWPKLKELGLMNCAFVDEIAAALPKSKVIKQLISLDLSMGCLGDADIDVMVASKEAFSKLESLNVEDSGLTNVSKPKVKVLAKTVKFGTDHEPERAGPDAYRFVSVGE